MMIQTIAISMALVAQFSSLAGVGAIPLKERRETALSAVEGAIESENDFDCESGVMAGITALTESDSYTSFTGDSYCDSTIYGIIVAGMEVCAESEGSALESGECAITMGDCCAADATESTLATSICQMPINP